MKCLDIINILRRGKYKIQKIMSEIRISHFKEEKKIFNYRRREKEKVLMERLKKKNPRKIYEIVNCWKNFG